MNHPLSDIRWSVRSELIDDLLDERSLLTVDPLPGGLEAEIIKINSGTSSYILKIWNKSSKPDISYQYELLTMLRKTGLSVSEPYGWGWNGNSEQVLFTSFDGSTINKMNPPMVAAIADLLAAIHQSPVNENGSFTIRKYDFIDYFYPGIAQYEDLHEQIRHLVKISEITQQHIIHGDFNLGNVVEQDGQYTVIDWTNGQLGDPRYDLAWAAVLMKIYTSDRFGSLFLSEYYLQNPTVDRNLEVFEAMACLHWILLNRQFGLPKRNNTMKRVKSIIAENTYLSGVNLS